MSQTIDFTLRTRPIALDGAPIYESLYSAETIVTLRAVKIVYDETTSSDAGTVIRIGKIGSPSFFATYTTEISMTAGTIKVLPQISNTLAPHETLTVNCDGLKSGAGIASVQIECTHTIILRQ